MDHTEGILQQKLARKLEKNKDKKLNLICRMAGNMGCDYTAENAVIKAIEIYDIVTKYLKEEK